MNRTKIEWSDYSWNPVTGCWGPGGTAEKPNRCHYCYAQKVANRFYRRLPDDRFAPVFWNYDYEPLNLKNRLSEPALIKKPSKIFVSSMGDLFGDWVPRKWIEAVLAVVKKCPQHTFQFLTKNPRRYQEFNPWPENCWLLTTITNQKDADERIPELLKNQAQVLGVSVEPMLGPIYYGGRKGPLPCYQPDKYKTMKSECWHGPFIPAYGKPNIDWLIIGAMTGPGSKAHQPKSEWVQSLIDQGRAANVPVFLKDNLKWPEKIQEWPYAIPPQGPYYHQPGPHLPPGAGTLWGEPNEIL